MPDAVTVRSVTVRPVETARDFRTFILLPWKIYRGNPAWVPPLIMDQKNILSPLKNPFFYHGQVQNYLAWRDGEPVGRISAIVNDRYNEFQQEKTGFFGFFESVNDRKVSDALLSAAEGWVRERGMERLRGPTNPSTNDTLGLLVDAFDLPPLILMPYNPPYYPELVEGYGLQKAKDLYAYYMHEDVTPISDKVRRVSELVRKRHNLTIRPFRLNRLAEEIELVRQIYNDAWTRNWGFVPWTDEELEHLGKELKPVAVPDLALFAYMGDEPVGFSLALPDFNQALRHANGRLLPFGLLKILWYSRKIDMIRVAIMGVRRKYQNLGIDAVFYYETYTRGTARGYRRGEFSWILEDNLPIRLAMEKWGARIYKTYRLYDKEF
jgi:GNAT superfamily N-acetyltransferase